MKRAELTRQKILTAAEAEFSEVGLYGARVDSIVGRAGVNKRMIYAYFGNKEQLYITVLSRVYSRLAQAEQAWMGEEASCEETIRRVIAMYFDFLASDPIFVRMLLWENLNGAGYIRSSEAGMRKAPSLQMLKDTVRRGIREGVFRADVDPENTVLSVNMCCFSYFSNIHTMSHLLQKELTAPDAVRSYAAHITEMILRFIRKDAEKQAEGSIKNE